MQDRMDEQELKDRLSLIESMIAEGRRTTESWGWTFVLWGVAYYVAIGWSALSRTAWAWPVTMLATAVITFAIASSRERSHAETTLGRAAGSIWTALGISMLLLFPALGLSGHLTDIRVFISVASGILGMANGASALLLRWKMQFACAMVWWIAAVVSCFATETQSTIVFLAAILLCQIVFGIYAMIANTRRRKRPQVFDHPAHA